MVTTTTNLGLRIADNATADSKYNLQRLDQLGSIYRITQSGAVYVRSSDSIVIQPEDASAGGTPGTGNLTLGDASNKIATFTIHTDSFVLNGTTLGYSSLDLTDSIVNADINSAAGIVYSKLDLTAGVVNADIAAAAAIAYSKLNLSNSITNADINASAAIAYSKLALTGSIVNADISATAAIARSKLGAGTANYVVINDGSGNFSEEEFLSKARGGTGRDMSSVTFPSSGSILTDVSSQTVVNKSMSGASNTFSDIAYSSLDLASSIEVTDLSGTFILPYAKLNLSGSIVDGDINSSAAITGTKVSPNFGSQKITTSGQITINNGTYEQGFQINPGITNDTIWTLPTGDGTSGQALVTDGSKVLAWASVMTSFLSTGYVWIGNGSNEREAVDVNSVGDIAADTSAGLTIKSGVIDNANINASAAIDATKIHDGSVSNTEYGYLDGVTSSIQTQLDAKAESLPDLSDVTISTPQNEQYLHYNGSNWENVYLKENVKNVVFADFTGGIYDIPTVSGVYHINTTGASGPLTVRLPNVASSNDNQRVRIIKEAGDEDVMVTTVGGTQLIGTLATQDIRRSGTGLAVISHVADNAYLIVQDSRQTFPNDESATTILDRTDWTNHTQSGGPISGFTITKNVGAGTIDVAAGEIMLRDGTSGDYTTNISTFAVSGVSGLAVTDLTALIVYVDYNSGSPVIGITSDFSTINATTRFGIGSVFRDGTSSMLVYQADPYISDFPAKLALIQAGTEPVRRSTGSIISNPSGLDLDVTAGTFYSIFSPATTPAIDTTGADTFTTVYGTGATWTRTSGVSAADNANYNNGGVLTALSANRYAVAYLYWAFDDPAELYYVYGTAQYTSLANAQAAAQTLPTDLPPELQIPVSSTPIGSIIVQEGDADIVEVFNITDTQFASTSATTHNNLAGLQGGTSGEYYHLNLSDYTKYTTNSLTASRPLAADGSGYIASTTFATWVAGTANQITVADDGDGSITLSTPQDIGTGSAVSFASVDAELIDYSDTFNATTDWSAGTGEYTMTYTAATHGKGTRPTVTVTQTSDDSVVLCVKSINSSGDVTLAVSDDPDQRFAGTISII